MSHFCALIITEMATLQNFEVMSYLTNLARWKSVLGPNLYAQNG
jgi:hypothetical protein